MSFAMPDLIVESIIRDGMLNIIADPTILDYVFAQLTEPYANRKFGSAEITKIKNILTGASRKQIAIIHSGRIAESNLPCYTIQLGSDDEKDKFLDEFEKDLQENLTEDELEDYVKVAAFTPTAYDSLTGMVSVADGVDLDPVYSNFIFVDAAAAEYIIRSGISNETGNKYFFIGAGESPDIVSDDCSIKSFIEVSQVEIRGSHHDVKLILGVHTKDSLLTIYLYTLLKYFLKSRRHSLIDRGLIASSMTGSDFTRADLMEGDSVFSRYLTVSGKVEDSWRSDQVQLIDNVVIDADPIE